jgi:hypothetical protein
MIFVEVYECGEAADETAVLGVLRVAKGLNDYHASQPFGLVYWHKRPFSVVFDSVEEATRFMEQLLPYGYQSRLADANLEHA